MGMIVNPLRFELPIVIDFDEPWLASQLRDTDFHQGFAIKSDGTIILIDDDTLHLTNTQADVVLTNSGIRAEAGVGAGNSETDGCIVNGELVFQYNGYWTFWDIDDLSFIRKVATTNGGSTCTNGPNPNHIYRFSYSDGTSFKQIDPLTDTVINTVALSPTLSTIQGSCWVPEDNCFYVTQETDSTIHRVRLNGATEQVYDVVVSGLGFLEGLSSFQGEVFYNVHLGSSVGLYRLDRNSHRISDITTASHVIEYVGQSDSSGAGAITVAAPTGHAAGDLLLLFDTCNPQGTGDRVTPSGWTTLFVWQRGGAAGHKGAVHWKFAASSSEPSVNLTDQGDGHLAYMMAFRGVDGTTPIPSSMVYHEPSGGDTQNYVFPAVTTTRDNSLVIGFAANGRDASSATLDQWVNFGWAGLDEAAEIVDRVHPFGSGNGIFVGAAEKATSGLCALGSVRHATGEDFVVTASIVLQPPP